MTSFYVKPLHFLLGFHIILLKNIVTLSMTKEQMACLFFDEGPLKS